MHLRHFLPAQQPAATATRLLQSEPTRAGPLGSTASRRFEDTTGAESEATGFVVGSSISSEGDGGKESRSFEEFVRRARSGRVYMNE